jgi:hypothetical protein
MRHRHCRLALGLWVLGVATVRIAQAQVAATELTAEQHRTVDTGHQVFVAEDVAASSWPRACTYQFVAATPEEAAAVFADYARHAAFIPDIKQSTVSLVIDQRTAEVDYVLDIPIVADEAYTVRDRLSATPDVCSIA